MLRPGFQRHEMLLDLLGGIQPGFAGVQEREERPAADPSALRKLLVRRNPVADQTADPVLNGEFVTQSVSHTGMVSRKLPGVKHNDGQNIARAELRPEGHYPAMPYAPDRIAALIRQHCEANGVSIRSLARDMEVSPGTIRAFLSGETKALRLDTAYKLAAAMKMTIWEFLGEAPPDSLEVQALTRQLRGIFQSLQDLQAIREQAAREIESLEGELLQIESALEPRGERPSQPVEHSRSAQRFP